MVHVAKCLPLMQAGKTMLRDKEGKEPANILSEYATSKCCKTYNAVILGTSEGLKNVNLPGLVKEDAGTLVDITKDAFKEIASVTARLDNTSEESVLKQLYSTIKGTVPDSCEAIKKFNRIMSKEITNNSGNNLDIKKLKNHYCFLHVIINLGDNACSNGLVNLDKCCLPVDALNDFHAKSSSST